MIISSAIIFKSKISSAYRYNWCICFITPLVFLATSFFFDELLHNPEHIILLSITVVFLTSMLLLMVWLGLHFILGTFLIIYEDGIKFRKPYRLLRFRFFTWDEITDVKLIPKGIMTKSFRNGGLKHAHQLEIYIKNKIKPMTITEHWVEDIGTAFNLIVSRWVRHA